MLPSLVVLEGQTDRQEKTRMVYRCDLCADGGVAMTQVDLCFEAPCRIPETGQCRTLLLAMQRGERLRPLEAALSYGVMALSQRIGSLKRDYGWPIKSRMVSTESGKRIAEYWL